MVQRGEVAYRNRSVSQSHFAMVPRADVPRSRFVTEFTHKTTFDAGWLVPVYLEEVLPGDSFNVSVTAFARMSTPLFPVMDNFHLDSFFFFVPNRLVWENWPRMMGEKAGPNDTTDYLVPQIMANVVPGPCSVADYFGIPVTGQTPLGGYFINALPARGYELIWNEWFRDQNLQQPIEVITSDSTQFMVDSCLWREPLKRGKRHDYFTSALPWPQKGDAVTLPLGDRAPVLGIGVMSGAAPSDTSGVLVKDAGSYNQTWDDAWRTDVAGDDIFLKSAGPGATADLPDVYADLSEATSATINAIRQAFQVQRLLERDARGGTRYTELLLAHFGVQPQDARIQRPEYLGGGSTAVNINPIAQTSATGLSGGDSPLGALGAVGTSVARHGFSGSFSEHGFIIGLVNVRADLTYQQGLHKLWSRRTRYDYYWPVFAHLGEQAILRKEIYFTGDEDVDDLVFGYQERWAEYRYHPSQITGMFRSTTANNIDEWHAAQHFESPPVLSDEFITENVPMSRILAAGEVASGQQFLFDSVFTVRSTRAMPTYSVPGFIDRF